MENAYDAVPYNSFPYSQTRPEHLYTVAKLFGLHAPHFASARILELGCASGGNIIPLAMQYPDCQIVGIDLSATQIAEGQKNIRDLQLNNITLQHLSILDVEPALGRFDYIIVHGILSWVPADVQNKIFDICKNNLVKTGVAYISYNTLPGWNMVQSIRDMMLYHTEHLKNPADKANQARLLLNFLKDYSPDKNSPYNALLSQETQLLSQFDNQYLLHDHLEQNNQSFYFHDFMKKAKEHQLQYLAEAQISSMFVGNFPEPVIEAMKSISHDIIRTEQYLDFITNRRFRSTLLCHENVPLNRQLNPKQMEGFYLSTTLSPKTPITDTNIHEQKSYVFCSKTETTVRTENPAIAHMMFILCDSIKPVLGSELVEKTFEKLAPNSFNPDIVRTEILSTILRLTLMGGMTLHSHPGHHVESVPKTPKVSRLCQRQAAMGHWVTSQKHEKIQCDLFARLLFQYLDGTASTEALCDKMLSHFEKNELQLHMDGQRITDLNQLRPHIQKNIEAILDSFAKLAILV